LWRMFIAICPVPDRPMFALFLLRSIGKAGGRACESIAE